MRVKIFLCYAHEDEVLLNKLITHLSPIYRRGLIDVWHDRDIRAGAEWEREISIHLNEAEIILLLVSPDFMDSDYCYSIEMKRAIERHERNEVQVIPIILRPVHWHGALFGKLQVLPTDGRPVKSWLDPDAAFENITAAIVRVVEKLLAKQVLTRTDTPPSSRIIQDQTVQESWVSTGVLGELVGSLANTQQWGQAEAVARSIADTNKRSQILHMLINELTKAQQWERAEAVALSIEDSRRKERALVEIVGKLADTQQWARAEAVARSIENIHERLRILSELSRLSVNAGEVQRAFSIAMSAPQHLWGSSSTLRSSQPYPSMEIRRFREIRRSRWLWLVDCLLVLLSFSLLLFSIINHIVWGIIVGIVLMIIAIIAIIITTRFPLFYPIRRVRRE